MKRYLLDTSFLIDLMKEHDKALQIHRRIKGCESTSIISAYEISKYSREASEVIFRKDLVHFERDDACRSAELFRALRKKGRMIPELDIMIAGICMNRNMVLVTRDAHFREVPGLDMEFY